MRPFDADVLIIGAGPAGLAAASACRQSNVSYCICETGDRIRQRSRSDASSLVQGTGGAGLYSDGKFSFFPSATKLWKLEDSAALRHAYEWFEKLVFPYGLTVPRFEAGAAPAETSVWHGHVKQKRYKSQYMSFNIRSRLIGMLEQEHEPYLMNGTSARLILPETAIDSLTCEVNGHWGVKRNSSYRRIVFAAGRHGPSAFHSTAGSLPTEFRYVELGVRIEQFSSEFFLRDQPDLDPKLLLRLSPDSECRTFCCCREGEAVPTHTPEGILSLSGRADVGDTGRSNVGFNLRTTDETLGTQIWREYRSIDQAVEVCETEWMQGHELVSNETMSYVSNWIGQTAASLLLHGLANLIDAFPDLKTTRVRLLGPCVEGVGWYPAIDRSLRVTPYPLWVAGDATGIFRGLTASFVSGYYAGLCASHELPKEP
ncbi:MAG: FAD-binding protein [Planctomycetaceae bacterium]|nr:FAD-binding protein [Planctomycetaceae bacterium]